MTARRSAIVLASASPRRLELLRQIGIEAEVRSVDIDEAPLADERPAAQAERLALAKARAARAALAAGDRVVIGADTLLAVDGAAVGKPIDRADAVAGLLRLAGREHEVYSAVAVASSTDRVAVSRSRVWFRDITAVEAEAYWRSGEPRDKAGGYAIQGLGAIFITRLDGSYSGVMGLPLYETATLLNQAGVEILETAHGG